MDYSNEKTVCPFGDQCPEKDVNRPCPYDHPNAEWCLDGSNCLNQFCKKNHDSFDRLDILSNPALLGFYKTVPDSAQCPFLDNCSDPDCYQDHPGAKMCSQGSGCWIVGCPKNHFSSERVDLIASKQSMISEIIDIHPDADYFELAGMGWLTFQQVYDNAFS